MIWSRSRWQLKSPKSINVFTPMLVRLVFCFAIGYESLPFNPRAAWSKLSLQMTKCFFALYPIGNVKRSGLVESQGTLLGQLYPSLINISIADCWSDTRNLLFLPWEIKDPSAVQKKPIWFFNFLQKGRYFNFCMWSAWMRNVQRFILCDVS